MAGGGGQGQKRVKSVPEAGHMKAQVRGRPEVVALNRYLEDSVGQQLEMYEHFMQSEQYREIDSADSAGSGHAATQEGCERKKRDGEGTSDRRAPQGIAEHENCEVTVVGYPGAYSCAGCHGVQAVEAYNGTSARGHDVQRGIVGGACRGNAGPSHKEDSNGIDQVRPVGRHDGRAASTRLVVAADSGRGGPGGTS